jgi:hypothetical protein
MERYYHNILNSLYNEVMGKDIDQSTYNTLVKCLYVDKSPGAIARIKESLISQKLSHDRALVSPENRKIFLLRDDNIKTSTKDYNNMRILWISTLSNVEKQIPIFKNLYYDLASKVSVLKCFILTNNNQDNTVNLLQDWANIGEIYVQVIDDAYSLFKNHYISSVRNQCFQNAKSHFGQEFDALLMIDGNLSQQITADKILSSFDLDEAWDIVCANPVFQKSTYHFDVESLRLTDEDLDIRKQYRYYDKFKPKKQLYSIDKFYSFDTWYRIQAAFGDIMIMHPKVFRLDQICSEQVDERSTLSLCTKFRNVFINPALTYETDVHIEGFLTPKPCLFIPRDAGFFSVFNYLLGTIAQGIRVYPYYNKDSIQERNKHTLKHFCYTDDLTQNSWFLCFEPIKYYPSDETHANKDILSFNVTQGEQAAPEFKHPNITRALYSKPEFSTWRKEVSKFYKKYIRPNASIIQKVDAIMSELKDDIVIGILYRHPAHSCEQKSVAFFRDYFSKIDEILQAYPSAKIYVTTDTDIAIYAFLDRYGSDIVHYDPDCKRSDCDNIIDWAIARGQGRTDSLGLIDGKGYEFHNRCCEMSSVDRVQHTKDIVTNVLCLSRCHYLIFQESNIALAVSYMNPDINMILL